jgi:antitoxin component of MazEF toxin-antitoxin module
MLTSKIRQNGGSLVITVPKKALDRLRWFQGDTVLIDIEEAGLSVTNFREHTVSPVTRRLDHGDRVTRSS